MEGSSKSKISDSQTRPNFRADFGTTLAPFWEVVASILEDFGCSRRPRLVSMTYNLMPGTSFDALESQVSNAHRIVALFCILFPKKIYLSTISSNMNALK